MCQPPWSEALLLQGEGVIKMSLSCDQPDDLIALALLHRGETEEGDDVLFEAGYEYRYSDRALMGGLGTQVVLVAYMHQQFTNFLARFQCVWQLQKECE